MQEEKGLPCATTQDITLPHEPQRHITEHKGTLVFLIFYKKESLEPLRAIKSYPVLIILSFALSSSHSLPNPTPSST